MNYSLKIVTMLVGLLVWSAHDADTGNVYTGSGADELRAVLRGGAAESELRSERGLSVSHGHHVNVYDHDGEMPGDNGSLHRVPADRQGAGMATVATDITALLDRCERCGAVREVDDRCYRATIKH